MEFEGMKSQHLGLGNRVQGIWVIYLFSAIWVLDEGSTAMSSEGLSIP